ncbi:MAG: hypothetical protein H0V29_00890 [Thermoleophilaceae bacterium]|nr:hypothetical protein [Thermoleophilaceae bacterium]
MAFMLLPAAASGQAPPPSGGASPVDPALQPPGKAKVVDGVAIPPPDAPPEIVAAIGAANAISKKPYRYGGGHALNFADTSAFDCSGAISFALKGAGLLDQPLDSRSFASWGEAGKGRWITVYTNPGHAYVVIAGVRFDTSAGGGSRFRRRAPRVEPGKGPRWRGTRSSAAFTARHPAGF